MFRDILLHLQTYPDPTPLVAVDQATALCAHLGAAALATAFRVEFPLSTNPLADTLLRIGELAKAEERRSADAAAALLARFETAARAAGLTPSTATIGAESYEIPDKLAALARTRDLCVIPYGATGAAHRIAAEAAIFGSGRPVLILPPRPAGFDGRVQTVLIAWDGGRAAARAVADALPILKIAATVRVLTVLNEKASVQGGSGAALVRHLAMHGVEAVAEEAAVKPLNATELIARRAESAKADLLVMGAFGRSGIREFILGGVTDDFLDNPPLPVLLSH
jgi:nucleotide-binding universal stress UspA family protein